MSQDGEAAASTSEAEQPMRRVRVHKLRPPSASAGNVSLSKQPAGAGKDRSAMMAAMDRRIAELVPGLAEAPKASPSAQALKTAAEIRSRQMAKEADSAKQADLQELDTIFDMAVPHALDEPSEGASNNWLQTFKPKPSMISLSPYQTEMINYQRMHLRKNIWFYRDRLSVPRGPCPLFVLKDAYVQGVVDENTLVWGQGLYDWLPMKNVTLLLPMIRTPEVRFGAWFKRTFSLKPALVRIRERRPDQRDPQGQSLQVERMR